MTNELKPCPETVDMSDAMKLAEALGNISRMRLEPFNSINMVTIQAAIDIATEALREFNQKYGERG